MQHHRWIEWHDRRIHLEKLAESIEEPPCHPDADAGSIGLTDIGHGPLDLTAQVPGDPVGASAA